MINADRAATRKATRHSLTQNLMATLTKVNIMQPHHNLHYITLSKKIGVFYSSYAKTWSAQIRVNGHTKLLGFFKSEEVAISARIQAEIKYGYRVCHGGAKVSAAEREKRESLLLSQDNESGYKNVIWNDRKRKWSVRQNIEGKRIHLGYFEHLDDAIMERIKVERKKY